MKLTWYGHSCFLLESAEGSAVFDPYSPGSVPGLALPALRADAVICSHGHSDHNYARGVTLTGRAPAFGLRQLHVVHDGEGGKLRGENTVTLVEAEGLRVVHLGDLGHMLSEAQIAKLGRVDLLLIPVGGYYTIGPAEAHALAVKIAPRAVVPMHYRGEGFGFDELGTLDAFTALFAAEEVHFLKSDTFTLTAAEPRGVIVPQLENAEKTDGV